MAFDFDAIVVKSVVKSAAKSSDSGKRAQMDVGWLDIKCPLQRAIHQNTAAMISEVRDRIDSMIDSYEKSLTEAAYNNAMVEQVADPSDADSKLLFEACKRASKEGKDHITWNVASNEYKAINATLMLADAFHMCQKSAEAGADPHLGLKGLWGMKRNEFKEEAMRHTNDAANLKTAWRLIDLRFGGLMVKGRSEECAANGESKARNRKKAKAQSSQEVNSDMT